MTDEWESLSCGRVGESFIDATPHRSIGFYSPDSSVSIRDIIHAADEYGLGWEVDQAIHAIEEPEWEIPDLPDDETMKRQLSFKLSNSAFRQLKDYNNRCYRGHTKTRLPGGLLYCKQCNKEGKMSGLSVGDVKISSGDHAIMPGLQDELTRLVPQLQPELSRVSCVRIRGNGNMNKRHSSKPVKWRYVDATITGFKMQAIGEYARQDVYFITNDKPALEAKMMSVMDVINVDDEPEEEEVKVEEKKAGPWKELREFMEENHLTSKEMAELLGCSGAAISHWAVGRYAPGKKYVRRFEELKGQQFKLDKEEKGERVETTIMPSPEVQRKIEEESGMRERFMDTPPEPVIPERRTRTIGNRVDAIMDALKGLEKEEAEKLWGAVISLIG